MAAATRRRQARRAAVQRGDGAPWRWLSAWWPAAGDGPPMARCSGCALAPAPAGPGGGNRSGQSVRLRCSWPRFSASWSGCSGPTGPRNGPRNGPGSVCANVCAYACARTACGYDSTPMRPLPPKKIFFPRRGNFRPKSDIRRPAVFFVVRFNCQPDRPAEKTAQPKNRRTP